MHHFDPALSPLPHLATAQAHLVDNQAAWPPSYSPAPAGAAACPRQAYPVNCTESSFGTQPEPMHATMSPPGIPGFVARIPLMNRAIRGKVFAVYKGIYEDIDTAIQEVRTCCVADAGVTCLLVPSRERLLVCTRLLVACMGACDCEQLCACVTERGRGRRRCSLRLPKGPFGIYCDI